MLENEIICLKGCKFIGCSWKKVNDNYYPEIIADNCSKLKSQHIITLKKDLNRWGCSAFNGFQGLLGGFSPQDNSIVVVSKPIGADSLVYRYDTLDSKIERKEKDLKDKIIHVPLKAKTIGKHLYLAGWDRAIVRRDGINKWTLISKECQTPELKNIEESYAKGFQDVDGFSESDMYAVGGKGDVWRYDAKRWYRVDVPVNVRIKSVCCAGDGFVYIGGNGFLLKGRENKWEIIQQESMQGLRPNDMVWFKDTLYISSYENNKLFQFKDGVFSIFPFKDGEIPNGFHSLAVCEDYLLSAGGQCISIFDGEKWENIYGGTTFKEQKKIKEAVKAVSEIEKSIDEAEEWLDDLKFMKNNPKK
jgi:hypothetical protein